MASSTSYWSMNVAHTVFGGVLDMEGTGFASALDKVSSRFGHRTDATYTYHKLLGCEGSVPRRMHASHPQKTASVDSEHRADTTILAIWFGLQEKRLARPDPMQ